jgi:hypothetical protein
MRSSQSRRCTLLDVMALIAATAVGFSLARTYSQAVLGNDLKPYPFLPRVLLTIWAYLLAILPVPAMWSIAVLGLSLRRPRRDLRRLTRQPGFVACGAVTLVSAIRLMGFLTLLARTLGNRFYTMSIAVGDTFSVTVSYPGPVNSATVYNSAYFASSAFGMSMAVAAAWLLLTVSGRWRSEPAWLDRLGRGLGAYWIAVIPFSCWWDYHMLY